MEQLHELQRKHMIVTMSGRMEEPCSLTISRRGCEYDSELEAVSVPYPDADKRLKAWYKAGAVSGYGDVKAQETKIDANVRDAREIPASEFRVLLSNQGPRRAVQDSPVRPWGQVQSPPRHTRDRLGRHVPPWAR